MRLENQRSVMPTDIIKIEGNITQAVQKFNDMN